jgi:uncharacterized protein
MKISLDQAGTAYVVRSYGPSGVRIAEQVYTRSLILTASTIVEGWRPQHIDDLRPEDLGPLVELRPEVLLIGSGARQQFPERATLAALYEAGVGFELMDTGAACRTFNLLVAEGREVTAALIIESAR